MHPRVGQGDFFGYRAKPQAVTKSAPFLGLVSSNPRSCKLGQIGCGLSLGQCDSLSLYHVEESKFTRGTSELQKLLNKRFQDVPSKEVK